MELGVSDWTKGAALSRSRFANQVGHGSGCLTLGRGSRILERQPLEVAAIFAVEKVGGVSGDTRNRDVVAWEKGEKGGREKRSYLQIASQKVEFVIRCETGPREEKAAPSVPAGPERSAHFSLPIFGEAEDQQQAVGLRAKTS